MSYVGGSSYTSADRLSFGDSDITNVGDIALDSISADGTDINIAVDDNSATALTIKQGSDAYLIVDTANASESISIGTGISGTAITIGHGTSEVTVADNLTVTGTSDLNSTLNVSGTVSLDGSANELRFYEGANYVGFEAPALSADQIWVLPTEDGDADEVLTTNGSGTLSWSAGGGGGGGAATVTAKDSTSNSDNPAVATSDDILHCDPSTAFSLALPATGTAGSGAKFIIKNTTSSTNAITLTTNASETIDGAATYAMTIPYGSITIYTNGSHWYIV